MSQQRPTSNPQRSGGYQHTPQKPEFDLKQHESNIRKWVRDGIDKETIAFAEKFGKYIAENKLTTSQIRNVFGEIRRIQLNGFAQEKTDFLLLKPKLAYAVKRHNVVGLDKFFEFFKVASDSVDTNDVDTGSRHYENLVNVLEAVLAYHKYSDGKE